MLSLRPLILSLIEQGYRLYVPSSPQRLALALAKHAGQIYDDLVVCVTPPLARIAKRIFLDKAIELCDTCSLGSSHYATLWCTKQCTDRLMLVAGTVMRNYRGCGLVKVDVRSILPNVYLVEITIGDNKHREHVTVNKEYDIVAARNPCLDDEAFRVLRKHFDRDLGLREAVEIISIELGVSKTSARKIIGDLVEKGCIGLDKNRKILLVYD